MQPNSLAFDIGAHYGRDTEILLEVFSQVVSVEPIPRHIDSLQERFVSQLGKNLQIVAAAVSNHVGQIEIFECDSISTVEPDWIQHSRFSAAHTWQPGIAVPTVTIDSLVAQFGCPQFIKIDTEGHELEAFMGMSRAYAQIVAFEWAEESQQKTLGCLAKLGALGYTYFSVCEMHDSLYFKPNWQPQQVVKDYLLTCLPERMTQWGMIWATK